jgi:hypothetical protein
MPEDTDSGTHSQMAGVSLSRRGRLSHSRVPYVCPRVQPGGACCCNLHVNHAMLGPDQIDAMPSQALGRRPRSVGKQRWPRWTVVASGVRPSAMMAGASVSPDLFVMPVISIRKVVVESCQRLIGSSAEARSNVAGEHAYQHFMIISSPRAVSGRAVRLGMASERSFAQLRGRFGSMEVVHPRCASLDVSKRDVKVCVRIQGRGSRPTRATVTTRGRPPARSLDRPLQGAPHLNDPASAQQN